MWVMTGNEFPKGFNIFTSATAAGIKRKLRHKALFTPENKWLIIWALQMSTNVSCNNTFQEYSPTCHFLSFAAVQSGIKNDCSRVCIISLTEHACNLEDVIFFFPVVMQTANRTNLQKTYTCITIQIPKISTL